MTDSYTPSAIQVFILFFCIFLDVENVRCDRLQAMRGVKPPQMDDSLCLLIARVSTGQVSHLGVRGYEGYCMG